MTSMVVPYAFNLQLGAACTALSAMQHASSTVSDYLFADVRLLPGRVTAADITHAPLCSAADRAVLYHVWDLEPTAIQPRVGLIGRAALHAVSVVLSAAQLGCVALPKLINFC